MTSFRNKSTGLNRRVLTYILARLTACALGFAIGQAANAHPVVFDGGTAVMGHQQGGMTEVEVIHSPRWWYGLGISSERMASSTNLLGKATVLVWRGNFPDFQSNFYLGLAAGKKWNSNSESHQSAPTHRASQQKSSEWLYQWNAEWDGEDREFYGRVHHSQTFKQDNSRSDHSKVRVGYAPYKATANEPALWGMLEWTMHSTENFSKTEHNVSPLMRFFYRNALFEVGSSLSGQFMFIFMFHFF